MRVWNNVHHLTPYMAVSYQLQRHGITYTPVSCLSFHEVHDEIVRCIYLYWHILCTAYESKLLLCFFLVPLLQIVHIISLFSLFFLLRILNFFGFVLFMVAFTMFFFHFTIFSCLFPPSIYHSWMFSYTPRRHFRLFPNFISFNNTSFVFF